MLRLLRVYQTILYASLVGAVILIFGIYIIQFGYPGPDEGYYLASSYGLSAGDPAFVSELHSAGLRNFDFVLAQVIRLWPNISVWQFRLIGILGYTAMGFFLYLTLVQLRCRQFVAVILSLTSVGLWMAVYRIYELSYISIPVIVGVVFTYVVITLHQRVSMTRWVYALYGLTGLLLGVATIARVTFLISWILMVGGTMLLSRRQWRGMLLTAVTAFGLVGLFFLSHLQQWPAIVDGIAILRDNIGYGNSYKFTQLYVLVVQSPVTFKVGVLAMVGVGCLLLLSTTHRYVIYVATWLLILLSCIATIFTMLWLFHQPDQGLIFYNGLVWGTVILGVIVCVRLWVKRSSDTTLPLLICLLGLCSFLQIFFSAGSLQNFAIIYAVPLFPIVISLFYVTPKLLWQSGAPQITALALIILGASSTGLAAFYMVNNMVWDASPHYQNGTFTLPTMGHISSTPDLVSSITEIVQLIDSQTNDGDFILSYYDHPLIYFLTRTRASTNTTWNSRLLWKPEIDDLGFKYLCEHQRFPKLVIQNHKDLTYAGAAGYTTDSTMLAQYVRDNFVPYRTYEQFTVLLPAATSDSQSYCEQTLASSPRVDE